MILSLLFIASVIGDSSLDKIVAIEGKNAKGGTSIGTGFLIDPTHVMTAAHVVDPLSGYKHTLNCLNEDEEEIDIIAIATNPLKDLAVLTIAEACSDKKPVKLAPKNEPYGNSVFAIGCPDGFCGMVTKGIISAYLTNPDTKFKKLYTDAKVWMGNSGGPLLNEKGQVVGLCSQILSHSEIDAKNNRLDIMTQNYGVFIPVSEIRDFLNTIK